jgi:hypothetical protein
MGTAKPFGDQAALKALKEGEEQGLKQYGEIAQERTIEPSVRRLIERRMIPQQRAHIWKIEEIINKVG